MSTPNAVQIKQLNKHTPTNTRTHDKSKSKQMDLKLSLLWSAADTHTQPHTHFHTRTHIFIHTSYFVLSVFKLKLIWILPQILFYAYSQIAPPISTKSVNNNYNYHYNNNYYYYFYNNYNYNNKQLPIWLCESVRWSRQFVSINRYILRTAKKLSLVFERVEPFCSFLYPTAHRQHAESWL